jgi:hypothetical protein
LCRTRGVDVDGLCLAVVAGFLLSAAATGADRYLTTTPALVAAAAAAFLLCARARVVRSARAARAALLPGLLAGALAAAPLPHAAIGPPAGVVTGSLGGGLSGDLFQTLDRIDQNPAALMGSRLTVSGDYAPASDGSAATVSRRIMACCAADTIAVGFDLFSDRPYRGPAGSAVVVSGALHERLVRGEIRYSLNHAIIRAVR